MDSLVERPQYLLVKRGLYYAPDRQGYTGVKRRAGRYREVDALGLDGVTAVHEDMAAEFSPACWEDTKLAEREIRITELERQLKVARDALGEVTDYGDLQAVRIARQALANMEQADD